MKIEIVTLGKELLEGQLDQNAPFLAHALARAGGEVSGIVTVGDTVEEVAQALERAVGRADAVILTGGLGVTPDDVTRVALASFLGVSLVRDRATDVHLKKRYRREGRAMSARASEQALVPEGAALLPNPVGLAPGIVVRVGGKPIYALPGVPPEMRAIAEESVFPDMARRGLLPGRASRILSLFGMSEAEVADRIASLVARSPDVAISFLPTGGHLRLVLSAGAAGAAGAAQEKVARLARQIRAELGRVVVACGEAPVALEVAVGKLLAARGLRLAVAESLTGGRVGALLTAVPGSSRYVDRVIVTYSNRAKAQELGISPALVRRHGAVSAEVAEAMARGVRRSARVPLGLATTGIAGPGGGSAAKPVGLVYVAVAGGRRAVVRRFFFQGTRERIQQRSALAALNELRLWLLAGGKPEKQRK